MTWLSLYEPGLQAHLHVNVFLSTISLALIATLVSSSLYQAPGDDAFRNVNDTIEPRNAKYVRYLGPSFGR